MNKITKNLNEEEQVQAVIETIYQAVLQIYDPDFLNRYLDAKRNAKLDRTDQMRIDIYFTNKINELRKSGKIISTAEKVVSLAQDIVENYAVSAWFGKAVIAADNIIEQG